MFLMPTPVRVVAASGGGGAFSDDFNRANENLEASADWSLHLGAAGDAAIVSNQVEIAETSGGDVVYTCSEALSTGYVQADVYVDLGTAGGLTAKAASGQLGLYAVRITSQRVQLRDDGGFLGNSANGAWPHDSTVTLRLEFSATQARILIDGVEAVGWTNYSSASGTGCGFINTGTTVFQFDNFEAG